MNKPLRYIQVGTGGWGKYWCFAVLPRLAEMGKAVCAAAVDMNADNLNNARQHLKLSDDQCFTEMEKAFDRTRADFAIVVVPPAHHEKVVDLALKHDLHILSEKPIADTMEACARIYKKVNAAGKKMAVTMSHRFDQDKQSLEALIKSGEYGPMHYLVGRFTCNMRKFGQWGEFRHKIPDTLLIEGTVHHFDIIRGLCAADAKTVYTTSWNPPWGEYAGDSCALVTIEMTNGIKVMWEGAKCNASTLNCWTNDYFRAECRDATLELDRRWLRILRDGGAGRPLTQDLPLLQQPVWMNPWLAERYCDWLLGEAPDHPTQLADNIQCAALLFAAVESAHTGKPVDVLAYLKQHLALG